MSDYFAEALKSKEGSLEHHGILGMKWGIRRFQNRDGSLTPLGKQRALSGDGESFRRHGERVAKDKREGAATAEKVTKGVGKTVGAAAGVGAGILGVGATDLSVAAAEAAASHIMSTASLASILSGSAAASASTAANLAGLGTLGAAAGVGGLVGAGVVGTGAAVIGHLIKKHGEKKAADIEEKYSLLADKMSHYSKKRANVNNQADLQNQINLQNQMNLQNQINQTNQINQMNQMQIANQMSQQAATQAINAGLMSASLGATGGATPYAFGMM